MIHIRTITNLGSLPSFDSQHWLKRFSNTKNIIQHLSHCSPPLSTQKISPYPFLQPCAFFRSPSKTLTFPSNHTPPSIYPTPLHTPLLNTDMLTCINRTQINIDTYQHLKAEHCRRIRGFVGVWVGGWEKLSEQEGDWIRVSRAFCVEEAMEGMGKRTLMWTWETVCLRGETGATKEGKYIFTWTDTNTDDFQHWLTLP